MCNTGNQPIQRMSLNFLLFAFDGRIGNISYVLGVILALMALLVLLALGFGTAEGLSRASGYGPMGPPQQFGFNPFLIGLWVFMVVVLLTMVWCKAALAVKRAHDFDASGAWILIGLVPYVNILLLLWLVFFPGSTGANSYGERRQWR